LPMLRRACRWKRHPPAMRSSWRISYIYIYPIVFVCFSQVKKLAKLGNPPPLNPPKDGWWDPEFSTYYIITLGLRSFGVPEPSLGSPCTFELRFLS
jgi:hypothetical protein